MVEILFVGIGAMLVLAVKTGSIGWFIGIFACCVVIFFWEFRFCAVCGKRVWERDNYAVRWDGLVRPTVHHDICKKALTLKAHGKRIDVLA